MRNIGRIYRKKVALSLKLVKIGKRLNCFLKFCKDIINSYQLKIAIYSRKIKIYYLKKRAERFYLYGCCFYASIV